MIAKPIRGFTLIELLIVMVISALAFSMVGGMAIEQLDNFNTLKQREAVFRMLKEAKSKAFILHHPVQVRTRNNTVDIVLSGFNQERLIQSQQFSNLAFPESIYDVNGNGFWVEERFYWQEGNAKKSTELD